MSRTGRKGARGGAGRSLERVGGTSREGWRRGGRSLTSTVSLYLFWTQRPPTVVARAFVSLPSKIFFFSSVLNNRFRFKNAHDPPDKLLQHIVTTQTRERPKGFQPHTARYHVSSFFVLRLYEARASNNPNLQ